VDASIGDLDGHLGGAAQDVSDLEVVNLEPRDLGEEVGDPGRADGSDSIRAHVILICGR